MSETNPIKECFYFLNHSFTGKQHPSRPTRKGQGGGGKHFVKAQIMCAYCRKPVVKSSMKVLGFTGNKAIRICATCYNARIESQRLELMNNRWKQSEETISAFADKLSECTKLGTCDILEAHHELLKEDPERMTTEFLIGMVCGVQGVDKYREARS